LIIAAFFELSKETFVRKNGIGSCPNGFKHALGKRVLDGLGAPLVDHALLLPDQRSNQRNILLNERQSLSEEIQANPQSFCETINERNH
jgi:hypothetical protein